MNSCSSRSCVWGVTARSILYAIHNGAAGVDPDTLHTRASRPTFLFEGFCVSSQITNPQNNNEQDLKTLIPGKGFRDRLCRRRFKIKRHDDASAHSGQYRDARLQYSYVSNVISPIDIIEICL